GGLLGQLDVDLLAIGGRRSRRLLRQRRTADRPGPEQQRNRQHLAHGVLPNLSLLERRLIARGEAARSRAPRRGGRLYSLAAETTGPFSFRCRALGSPSPGARSHLRITRMAWCHLRPLAA